jgi:S-formylglutathione hydrolase FrmB
MPFDLMKTSLIGLPFLFALAGATIGLGVLAWWPRRRRWRRALFGCAAFVLALTCVGAWVNAYFAYLPSVGAVLGQRARDQITPRQFQRRVQLIGAGAAAPAAPVARTTRPPRIVKTPARGVVERVSIPGTVSGFRARPAQVYLPPAWFATPRPRLPVIELLHGTPGTPEDWTRAGMADVTADEWAAGHDGVAPVIVMPDPNGGFTADTECVDGRAGAAETYLTADVRAWVTSQLGTAADRGSWAIVGSSEGGYCALDLALRHPDLYAAFVDLSGLDRATWPGGALRLFGGSRAAYAAHLPAALLARRPAFPLAARFDAGSADGSVTRSVTSMAAATRRVGIDTSLVLRPNAHHTWRVWHRAFTDALPWLMARLHTPARAA